MGKRLRAKLTYSNVIASIALFAALSGVAVAANNLPRHSVGPKQLKRGAVTAAKLRKEAVKTNKLARKAVKVGKIGPNAVLPGNITNGAINTDKIATNTIRARNIHNNVVTTNKLNNNAVTHQKLGPEAVGAGNMQNESVGPANLRDNSVGTGTLRDGSVTAAKLGSDVGPLTGTLKSGQTLRGVFSLAESEATRASQSFQFPLAAALSGAQLNVILKEDAPTAACPGRGKLNEAPEAAAGNLCVYVNDEKDAAPLEIDEAATNRLGFAFSPRKSPKPTATSTASGR